MFLRLTETFRGGRGRGENGSLWWSWGDSNPYLFNAIEALSQMSYSPTRAGGLLGHYVVDYTRGVFGPRKKQPVGRYAVRRQ